MGFLRRVAHNFGGFSPPDAGIILGREMHDGLEVYSARVEGLVRLGPSAISREVFRFSEMDAPLATRVADVRGRGHALHSVARPGRVGTAAVGLALLPADHCLAYATDNIACFTTARYRERRLVVRGPGEGPEVTTAGVFTDLLWTTATLGVAR